MIVVVMEWNCFFSQLHYCSILLHCWSRSTGSSKWSDTPKNDNDVDDQSSDEVKLLFFAVAALLFDSVVVVVAVVAVCSPALVSLITLKWPSLSSHLVLNHQQLIYQQTNYQEKMNLKASFSLYPAPSSASLLLRQSNLHSVNDCYSDVSEWWWHGSWWNKDDNRSLSSLN